MSNLNGKKNTRFSGKLKLEAQLQKLGDATVTLRLFDEAGMLNSAYENEASKMIIVTHGGRPADRLNTALRKEVLLVKECDGFATLSGDRSGALYYHSKESGWV